MAFKILIADDLIEDKTEVISNLPKMLKTEGFEVVTTPNPEEVYDLVFESRADLVLLDIEFKNQSLDGFEICESIRLNDKKIPIILITGVYTETEDVLKGFKLGISDYVTRPRDNREIIARIRANLPPEVVLVDGVLCVDFIGRQVYVKRSGKWQEAHLAPLEFKLLEEFINNAGLPRLTTTLKDILWGDADKSDDVLAVLIHRLREKIEPDPSHPYLIENIKGLGYRFTDKLVRLSRRACENLIDDSENGEKK